MVVYVAAESLWPGLLIGEAGLTPLGSMVLTGIITSGAAQQMAMLSSDLQKQAELRPIASNQQSNIQQALRANESQAWNDYPGDEEPWWSKLCIICIANAQEEGERPGGIAGGLGPRTRIPWSRYIGRPQGAPIRIPEGWEGRISNNGKGVVFQRPGSSGNANSIRISDPDSKNPNGSLRYYDSGGRPLDINGNRSMDPAATHIDLNRREPLPGLEKWYNAMSRGEKFIGGPPR
jgi:hypothetical protein